MHPHQAMRRQLFDVLTAKLPGRDFNYFLTQRGMFSYRGPLARAGRAAEGRVRRLHPALRAASAAGLNSRNGTTAEAFATVMA